ncbi:MAG: RHS repeat-associated core domain-containing protein [Planctomycetota bacterium]
MSGGSGYGTPAVSDSSIYLMRASAAQCATDISQPGPIGVWEHTRSNDSGFPESTTGRSEQWDLGGTTGWYLESIGGDDVELFQSASSKVTFENFQPVPIELGRGGGGFGNLESSAVGIDATMTKLPNVTDVDDLDNDGNTFESFDIYKYTKHDSGIVLIFPGFNAGVSSHYRGRMVEKTTVAYQAASLNGTSVAYDTNSNVTVVTTPEPQGSRIDYSYVYTGSTNQVDTIEVRDGPLATDTVIKKAEYTYYNELTSPNTGLGNNDDLVQVKRSELASDGASWIESLTQYRYYRDSSSDGRAHQIKMEFDAFAIERAIAAEISISSAADMLEASDSTVEIYASKSYTYYTEDIATDNSGTTKCVTPWSTSSGENLQSKYVASGATVSEFDEFNTTENFGAVKTLSIGPGSISCCGGSSVSSVTRTYHYINLNGGTSTDPSEVVRLVIEDTEDGADPRNAIYRKVYGLNDKGIAIREAFIEDPTVSTLRVWCESRVFDSDELLTELRMPSAHIDVDSNTDLQKFFDPTMNTNDTDSVSSTVGQVYYFEYSSSLSDGKHRTGTLVREGAGTGSRYYIRATDWGTGSDDEPTNFKLAEYVYPSRVTSRSDASRIKIAGYSYDFWDTDDTALKQATTTLPAIPTSQNGSGVATTTEEFFDEEGRLRFTKDGEGYVNYMSYHPDLGVRAIAIIDVNTASLNSDVTGNGGNKWVAWSGAAPLTRDSGLPTALELTSKSEIDNLGRPFKRIDARGGEHYLRYEDNKAYQFSYWAGGTSGTAGLPVFVTETNESGQPTSAYTVRPSKSQWNSGDALPELASYTAADYVSRTEYIYQDARLAHVDRYYDADAGSGGYYRKSYLYDDQGRRGATVQEVAASKYQVSAQLFDVRGRVIESRRGVATVAPTDYDSLDNSPPGTPTGFDGYATISTTTFDSGGIGDGYVTSSRSYYGTGANDFTESIPQLTFRGHSRGVLQKNGTTKFGPYSVQDIDWMGRTTASASYASEPSTWPDDYSDYVIHSSGGSADQPNTSGHYNVSVRKYDDLGRVYQTLSYPGTEATKHFKSNAYFDRRGNLVASEEENGMASESAYDGAGRQYQSRSVTTLESTKYTSGEFNYRAPTPDPGYGVGSESSLTGGDDSVITLSHSVFSDTGQVTESHSLEAHHDDTNGIDLSADDDYVRSSRYFWYDDADRLEVSATHGSGNGSGLGDGTWTYVALPASITKPTTSSDAELVTLYSYNTDRGVQDEVATPSGKRLKSFFDDLGRRTYVAANFVNFDDANVGSTIGGGTNDDEDQVVGYEFDGLGNTTKLTAYNASSSTANQVTEYKREDNFDPSLVTMEIYPDGDASSDNVQMTYHLDGSLNTKTDQRGVVFTYTYDDARRTTLQAATTIPAGVDDTVQAIGRAYDTNGRVETVTSYAGTTTGSTVRNQIKYTYGTHGQITQSEQDHSGAVGGTEPSVQYAYDETASSNVYEDGLRRESVTYPDGSVFFYGYDSSTQGSIRDRRSQVAEIRETNASGQQLVAYEYTGGGRVAVSTYTQPDIHQHADRDGDGDYEIWDRFGRVTQSYWRPTTGSGANYLDRVDYGNDRAGNRTYRNIRVDQITGATTDQRDQAYSYDGLDRLTDTDEGTANDTTGAITTKTFEQQWKLDQLGNWEEFDQDDDGNGAWDLEQDRTHNDANEVTAIGLQSGGAGANWADPAFDAAGNMTTIPKPDALTVSLSGEFDAWNRMVSLDNGTAASYEYDGLNRRIKRVEGSVTTHFYYNEAWQCLEERATEVGSAIKQFLWGPQYIDELLLRDRDADGNAGNGLEERLYAIHQSQYSISTLIDSSGTIQERFAYRAYGGSTVLNADLTTKNGGTGFEWEHRYTGRRVDSYSGLQLNRNRLYHSSIGRWCSRDPVSYSGSPWNLYEYVRSKPVRYTDANGQELTVDDRSTTEEVYWGREASLGLEAEVRFCYRLVGSCEECRTTVCETIYTEWEGEKFPIAHVMKLVDRAGDGVDGAFVNDATFQFKAYIFRNREIAVDDHKGTIGHEQYHIRRVKNLLKKAETKEALERLFRIGDCLPGMTVEACNRKYAEDQKSSGFLAQLKKIIKPAGGHQGQDLEEDDLGERPPLRRGVFPLTDWEDFIAPGRHEKGATRFDWQAGWHCFRFVEGDFSPRK